MKGENLRTLSDTSLREGMSQHPLKGEISEPDFSDVEIRTVPVDAISEPGSTDELSKPALDDGRCVDFQANEKNEAFQKDEQRKISQDEEKSHNSLDHEECAIALDERKNKLIQRDEKGKPALRHESSEIALRNKISKSIQIEDTSDCVLSDDTDEPTRIDEKSESNVANGIRKSVDQTEKSETFLDYQESKFTLNKNGNKNYSVDKTSKLAAVVEKKELPSADGNIVTACDRNEFVPDQAKSRKIITDEKSDPLLSDGREEPALSNKKSEQALSDEVSKLAQTDEKSSYDFYDEPTDIKKNDVTFESHTKIETACEKDKFAPKKIESDVIASDKKIEPVLSEKRNESAVNDKKGRFELSDEINKSSLSDGRRETSLISENKVKKATNEDPVELDCEQSIEINTSEESEKPVTPIEELKDAETGTDENEENKDEKEDIRKFAERTKWRHVPGLENISNLSSRGYSVKKLKVFPWWEGPHWPKLHREEWPHCNLFDDTSFGKRKSSLARK
ncbi:immunoglobulin A1 protease-like [Uloborus diversus]|uniref:immunoglobulin A1 protease-like n=1 Tax=Uloborus diversus TaxID=327109 RepID=UPI002409B677|nr:immunoglobulin A1 protease-like [Uloborus diversus]